VYAWLWRHLPGPTPVRVAVAAALVAGVVALLFLVVFPQVAQVLNPDDGGTLG
jgi:hypothetical protein